MYRTVQEALTNACRHSQSKKVRVELVRYGDQLGSMCRIKASDSIRKMLTKVSLGWPVSGK